MHASRTPFPDSDTAALGEARESAFLLSNPGVSDTRAKNPSFFSPACPVRHSRRGVESVSSLPLEQC